MVRKITGFLFILSIMIAVHAYAEAPFEGVLEGYGQGPEVTNSAQVFLKGNKARLFPLSGALAATNGLPFLDYDNMKILLIADKEKYYLEMPLEAMEKNLTAEPLKLTSTGKKEPYLTVNGEEFKGTDKETGVDIVCYGTKDIVSKLNPLIAFQRISKDGLALSKAGRALLDMGYFPVKVQALRSGKVFFFWEVRKIDRKPVDPTMLKVPAGYLKFSDYMKKNRAKTGR